MTVIVSKPAVNLREELASLRNQGGYQEQQFYFDGLVTNGTFDSATDWVVGAGASITGGELVLSSQSSGVQNYQSGSFVGVYGYSFEVTDYTAGGVEFYFHAAGSVSFSGVSTATAVGTYTGTVTISGTPASRIAIRSIGTTTASVGIVSLFETDGTDVVHRMPKGWVPKDVFEDGLLQREGSAHDYEVVYDGFDYYVKPTVAPSATTQTCVIGVKA
jgi:hypothetical protein